MTTRISVKWVRRGAVIGAVAGLILLWIGVRLKDPDTVRIGSLDVQYNMAIAALEGKVTGIDVDEEKNTFRITIHDGTGQAVISGYNKLDTFREVLGDRFPQPGDIISAVGNLSISESWGITMFMASPRRLNLVTREGISDMKIGEVSIEEKGNIAWFQGTVTAVRTFKSGKSLTISDGSGEIDLTVFNTELSGYPEHILNALNAEGSRIKFLGTVDEFRGTPQLRLAMPDKTDMLQILSAPMENIEP